MVGNFFFFGDTLVKAAMVCGHVKLDIHDYLITLSQYSVVYCFMLLWLLLYTAIVFRFNIVYADGDTGVVPHCNMFPLVGGNTCTMFALTVLVT